MKVVKNVIFSLFLFSVWVQIVAACMLVEREELYKPHTIWWQKLESAYSINMFTFVVVLLVFLFFMRKILIQEKNINKILKWDCILKTFIFGIISFQILVYSQLSSIVYLLMYVLYILYVICSIYWWYLYSKESRWKKINNSLKLTAQYVISVWLIALSVLLLKFVPLISTFLVIVILSILLYMVYLPLTFVGKLWAKTFSLGMFIITILIITNSLFKFLWRILWNI